MSQQTKRILICYSPKDADGAAELAAHLVPARGSVSIWTLDKVLPGDPVRESVEAAAKGADAALLLLSANFFKELDDPRFAELVEEIRQQHRKRELRLIPILWLPCDWRAVDWVAKLRPLPGNERAIALHDKAQRDQKWAEIAQQLGGQLRVGVRRMLGAVRPDPQVVIPDRETLIAKSRNLLEISEVDFETAVDLELGIHQVPQLVRAQHVPHTGARSHGEPRPLEDDLLEFVLRVERLLLVGQPGAGKTHTLRTLCGQLLEVAVQDDSLPVPFIINFSTFSNFRGNLRAWLAEGLKESASIPMEIGSALLAQGQLFLLIDGLDEMAAETRTRALAELNTLISAADIALSRCIVCSRTLEYAEANIPLVLPAALELQPLSSSQVQDAFAQAGPPVAPLCAAMANAQELESLLQTPLLLSVAVRAFAGTPDLMLSGRASVELRQVLYDAYVAQMLRRTTANRVQAAILTLRCLRWLAQHLNQEQSSLFLLEWLQPESLTGKRTYRMVFRLVRGSAFGLVIGLVIGLFGALKAWSSHETVRWRVFVLAFFPVMESTMGLVGGLVGGLIGGLSSIWVNIRDAEKIELIERLHWSRAHTMRCWKDHLRSSLNTGLGVGLVNLVGLLGLGTYDTLAIRLIISLLASLFVGLCVTLVTLPIRLFAKGWVKELHAQSAHPNEGIRSSLRNGLRVGLGTGLIFGLSIMLGAGLFARSREGLFVASLVAPISGLAVGLGGGFGEVLKHYVLRAFLWREGKLPLRLVPWLESCRARLLLRRQGGSYMFWHITLQDYFAELDDVRLAEMAKRIEAKPVYEQSY